jgi:hypothetical protein
MKKLDDRLHMELRHLDGAWHKRARQAELWGTLTDSGIPFTKVSQYFGPIDQFLIWIVRSQRRLRRNMQTIAALSGAAAVGMGLSVGLLRAIGSFTTTVDWPAEVVFSSQPAAILGFALVLAMQVTISVSRSGNRWKPIVAGAVGFGLGYAWIMKVNGLQPSDQPLSVVFGIVFGLVLAWLADMARAKTPKLVLALGVVIAGIVTTMSQALVIYAYGRQAALPLTHNRIYYSSEWPQAIPGLTEFLGTRIFAYIALIDAALIGVCLSTGLVIGQRVASQWLPPPRASKQPTSNVMMNGISNVHEPATP